MDKIGTGSSNSSAHPSSEPSRKHMYTPAEIKESARTSGDADLTRGHGQGNGVRVHGAYFAVVSVAALVLIIVGIALAARMM